LRCENRRSGFSGSTWVSLMTRNWIGSRPELLGHLVHRDFERHHAGRLARGSHRVPLGQVELGETERRQSVRAGVEQLRLGHRRFRIAIGQIARGALVRNGRDRAIRHGPDPNALHRGRPVRGVIGDQRPRKRHLHWPPGRLRAENGQHRVRPDEELAAKAAADIGRVEPHVLGLEAEHLGDAALAPGDHLVGGPEVSLSPSHAAIVACGSIMAWLSSAVV
jgi:hypothetical protein